MSTLNILLVDDDRMLVTTLSHGLRRAMGKAISVVFCASGLEASALLATQAFDLVISDLHMPGMTGLELLKQTRRDHPATSLVLITSYATDALAEEAHQLGIGYIAKPFEPALLVQLIKGLIHGAETAKINAGIENAPRRVTLEGNENPGHFVDKVCADPAVPNS
ncbi:MAG TPA: response regulator [Anaerolineales bacterium]|nr:response regulator [Anaerolineales bacterium]